MDLLAILGRGIQRLDPNSDSTLISSWALTEDIEICDSNLAHLTVRVPKDDSNQSSIVGGGELNLRAGLEFIKKHQPRYVVCAYAHRAEYLLSVNGPTESEVISNLVNQAFRDEKIPSPNVLIWNRDRVLSGPSNTGVEVLNIFKLALEYGLQSVGIVTVGVHVPRTATYTAKHRSVHDKYRVLSVNILESEEILLRSNELLWGSRVEILRASQSFARNWAREADGIQKIIRDVYRNAKPRA